MGSQNSTLEHPTLAHVTSTPAPNPGPCYLNPKNFSLEQTMKAQPWPLYPLERNPIPTVQEAGWDPAPVQTGTEHLMPTPGFKPWGKKTHTPKVEGWVCPRSGLDILEKRKINGPYQDLNRRPSSQWNSRYTDHAIPAHRNSP